MDAERKAKLGTKWTCYSCAAKFYDLNKPEPVCPKCEADQRESPAFQEKAKSKPKAKKAARKKPAKAEKVPTLDDLDKEEPRGAPNLDDEGLGLDDFGDDDVGDSEIEEIEVD